MNLMSAIARQAQATRLASPGGEGTPGKKGNSSTVCVVHPVSNEILATRHNITAALLGCADNNFNAFQAQFFRVRREDNHLTPALQL